MMCFVNNVYCLSFSDKMMISHNQSISGKIMCSIIDKMTCSVSDKMMYSVSYIRKCILSWTWSISGVVLLCWQGAWLRAKGPARSGLSPGVQTSLAVFTARPEGNGCNWPRREWGWDVRVTVTGAWRWSANIQQRSDLGHSVHSYHRWWHLRQSGVGLILYTSFWQHKVYVADSVQALLNFLKGNSSPFCEHALH